MRMYNLLLTVAVLIVAISLISIWFYPSVQDFMASNTMWNGIRDFSRKFNAINIESLDEMPVLPENAVLVAIPYLPYSNNELSALKRFVDGGGTLLLMDDYGYGNSVLVYLGAGERFTNESLLDPLFCYKNPYMPRVTDFATGVEKNNVSVLMLNHATTLTNVAEGEVIAWSSDTSFLDINQDGSQEASEPKGPFAVAAEFRLGKGRVALVSDPSILINTMVGRDNNYDFIRYLISHQGNQTEIMVDSLHLTKTPLDVSKTRLVNTREWLSNPYSLVGITAFIFAVISGYTLKKGGSIG